MPETDTLKKGVDFIGVSVGAMIFNDKGELFLAKRGRKAKNERGTWENPGGAVEYGEQLEDAVRREIREEYGFDIDILDKFPAADHLIPADKQHWVATTFIARIKPGQTPKILEPEKCDAIGWYALNKLPQPLSIITQMDLRHMADAKKFPDHVDSSTIIRPVKGFVNFVREQGVVGLAVGFILGGSIQKVVTSFVGDIINPTLSILLGSTGSMKDAYLKIGSVKIMWGSFLNNLIDFLVIAAVVYFGVKMIGLDKLDKKKGEQKK